MNVPFFSIHTLLVCAMFLVLPNGVFAAASGDGKILYGINANTTPSVRDFVSATNTFNAAVGTVAGGTALQTVLRASPARDEFIGGYVNAAGTLQVMCYNGTSWSNEWSVAVGGTGTMRRFDISYETNSGDAIVLYSTNTGTTNELAYRTKLGSTACGAGNWSGATNLDPVRTTGIVQWVRLAWDRRAAQNLITAIWADANSDLSAMVWSGSAWGNEPGVALETALQVVAAAQDIESFDVDYESTSGDVMVVWGSGGNNGTNGAFYATCTGGTSGCTWGTKTAMPTFLDDATTLDIAGDPNSDQILFGSIGKTGNDLQYGVWSGSAWTNTANGDTSTAGATAGVKSVAVGWLTSGVNTRGVLTYHDQGSTRVDWVSLSGTTWTVQTDFLPTPSPGALSNYDIQVDPFGKDRLMLTGNDANSDIQAKQLVLSGTTFTWSDSVGGGPIEANTTSAVYQTFSFAYNRYIPVGITSYTNNTEAGLSYSGGCTTCGARIGSGGFSQTITITGTNFGTDPGVGNRSSATYNVKVGTHQIPDLNVTAWGPTSISIVTNTVNDSDASWGAEFGGTAALTVTAMGAISGGVNYYILPQVTSVTSILADAAREYDAGDSDGVITLNGTRFGTAQTGGYVRILGCDASTCSSPAGSVTTTAWSNTAITAQVPTVIADNVYTGSLIMQQGSGSNNKTHTYTTTGFRVLPRITSLVPSSGSVGDSVTINGNHLCQAGAGSCPIAFSISDKVTFTSGIDATVFTSWSNTAIVTAVPASSATGDIVVTSNTYTSNGSLFTIILPTPSDPTSLNQYRDSGLTQVIAVGAAASSTPIYLTMTMQAPVSGGTLYPQIEYKDTSTNFTCTGSGACGAAVEGSGFAGPGPVDCTVSNCKISISPSDNTYHWQARVRHNKSGIDYYSNWVSFGGNSDPSATDFYIDTTPPVITAVSSGTPGSNSATITWSTLGELSTSQVQYAEGSPIVFGACSGDCTSIIDIAPMVFSHSISLSNLNSGTTYSYRVRSRDAAGNESVSSNYTFATQSVTDPAKSVQFHVAGIVGAVTNASPFSDTFSVSLPENATTTKSIFIEIRGVYSTTGTPSIAIQTNGESLRTYAFPNVSGLSYFRILHPVSTILNSPSVNTITVTPDTNSTIYTLSGDVTIDYSYTP